MVHSLGKLAEQKKTFTRTKHRTNSITYNTPRIHTTQTNTDTLDTHQIPYTIPILNKIFFI